MHLAQRLNIAGWSHSKISKLYFFFTLILCLGYKINNILFMFLTLISILLFGVWLDANIADKFPLRKMGSEH